MTIVYHIIWHSHYLLYFRALCEYTMGKKILGENVAWQPLNVFKNDLANQIYYLVRTVHPLHLHNQCLRRQLYTDACITDWNPQKQAANHDQIS